MLLKIPEALHSALQAAPRYARQRCEDEVLYASIKNARCELDAAVDIFNELTDHAAVDYAAYNILAARAKYSYLLQLAKAKNLSL